MFRRRARIFSGYAVVYGALSVPHVNGGETVRVRVAGGAFVSSLRPVPLLVDHDPEKVIAGTVELEAAASGIRLRCRTADLPDPILGLSVGYQNARWRHAGGDVWTLLDGEIVHVSVQSGGRPHFRATLATCRVGGVKCKKPWQLAAEVEHAARHQRAAKAGPPEGGGGKGGVPPREQTVEQARRVNFFALQEQQREEQRAVKGNVPPTSPALRRKWLRTY